MQGLFSKIKSIKVVDSFYNMCETLFMTYAIQTSGNGQIILIGESMEKLQHHVKVNPTRHIVKKTKKGWVQLKGFN